MFVMLMQPDIQIDCDTGDGVTAVVVPGRTASAVHITGNDSTSAYLNDHTAHYEFFVTFRDRSREPNLAIRLRRIYTLCQKKAPRKVIPLANSFQAQAT
jgi:hypothetical protein